MKIRKLTYVSTIQTWIDHHPYMFYHQRRYIIQVYQISKQVCISFDFSYSDNDSYAGPRPLAGRVADRRCTDLCPRSDLSEVDDSLANRRWNRPSENGARKCDSGGATVGQLTNVSTTSGRVSYLKLSNLTEASEANNEGRINDFLHR